MKDYDRDMNPFNDDNIRDDDARDDETRDDDNDFERQGRDDQFKGKMNEAAGNVQRKFGDMTNNEDIEAEGEERRRQGKMQQGLGDIERTDDDDEDMLDH